MSKDEPDVLATIEIDEIHSLAWSPDGLRIAAGQQKTNTSNDYFHTAGGTVYIWDSRLTKALLTYTGHRSYVKAVAWSPDGRLVASASCDHTVHIWEAHSGRLLRQYRGHRNAVLTVAWSPDGSLIASGGDDGTIQIWDASSGRQMSILTPNEEWISVLSLDWSPDGTLLASAISSAIDGSDEDVVLVWRAATGQTLWRQLLHPRVVAWSPDGRSLAVSSMSYPEPESVSLWQTSSLSPASSGKLLQSYNHHRGQVNVLAWAPNGRWILSGGNGNVQIWDVQTGRQVQTYPANGAWEDTETAAWSPDSRYIVVAGTTAVRLLRFKPWPLANRLV